MPDIETGGRTPLCRGMSAKWLAQGALRVSVLAASLLGGCNVAKDDPPSTTVPPGAPQKGADIASVMVDHVSYRYDRSMEYTLLDLRTDPPKPVGGAIVDRLASGGDKNCCVSLPNTWRPGMKFRVTWEESDRERIYPDKYVRDIEVPKYDAPADLYVVFLPNHEAELIVSAVEPGHAQWRGRINQLPWDYCLSKVDRKTCKLAIPNYGGLSESEMRGLCVYFKKEGQDNYCESILKDCVRYYEDRKFCNDLLWDPTGRKN